MHEAGMAIEEMLPRLTKISQIEGRMENIAEGQDFHVIVDYAHTPDGFRKSVSVWTGNRKGQKIYAVFGCAGKRDKVKRKVFGPDCRQIL